MPMRMPKGKKALSFHRIGEVIAFELSRRLLPITFGEGKPLAKEKRDVDQGSISRISEKRKYITSI